MEVTSAGLKHSVTAKPDSISHQTSCKSIRFIIFSLSKSNLCPFFSFPSSSPTLSLFFTTVPFEESMLCLVLISLFYLLQVLNDAQGPQWQNKQEESRIRGLENLSHTLLVFVLQELFLNALASLKSLKGALYYKDVIFKETKYLMKLSDNLLIIL